jgi:hypothetical protein
MEYEQRTNFVYNVYFSGCIPLKYLFGFFEDYIKILLNCYQQLVFNRSSTNYDALHVTDIAVSENIEKNKKVKIELSKVLWKMPIVRVNDKEKLKLLKVLNSREPLPCAFRNFDLYECPVLPQNTSYSWTVKSSSVKSSTVDFRVVVSLISGFQYY